MTGSFKILYSYYSQISLQLDIVYPWILCLCVCFLFIDIQRAPLQSNTTCFRVKYLQYGYIYLPLMYNFFYFL